MHPARKGQRKAKTGIAREVDIRDLITKATAARLRGISRPSFLELLERHNLSTYTIGGVEFVFRSEVLSLKTKRQQDQAQRAA